MDGHWMKLWRGVEGAGMGEAKWPSPWNWIEFGI